MHAAHTRTKLHMSLTVDSREAAYSVVTRERRHGLSSHRLHPPHPPSPPPLHRPGALPHYATPPPMHAADTRTKLHTLSSARVSHLVCPRVLKHNPTQHHTFGLTLPRLALPRPHIHHLIACRVVHVRAVPHPAPETAPPCASRSSMHYCVARTSSPLHPSVSLHLCPTFVCRLAFLMLRFAPRHKYSTPCSAPLDVVMRARTCSTPCATARLPVYLCMARASGSLSSPSHHTACPRFINPLTRLRVPLRMLHSIAPFTSLTPPLRCTTIRL